MTQEKGGDGAERIRDGFDERRGSPGDSVSNESTFNADLGLSNESALRIRWPKYWS